MSFIRSHYSWKLKILSEYLSLISMFLVQQFYLPLLYIYIYIYIYVCVCVCVCVRVCVIYLPFDKFQFLSKIVKEFFF